MLLITILPSHFFLALHAKECCSSLSYPVTFFWRSSEMPPNSWGFQITHGDTLQSVGFLWAEIATWQQKHSQETNIHAPGGIRTRNPSKRAAANPRLRPLGHWDWDPVNKLCKYYGTKSWPHRFSARGQIWMTTLNKRQARDKTMYYSVKLIRQSLHWRQK
jgi:hypothetical protein